MNNWETSPAIMESPYEAIKQQRLAWGAALIVGLVLIFYEHAPIIPVIAGCVLVPAIAALRSWFRLRSKPRSRLD